MVEKNDFTARLGVNEQLTVFQVDEKYYPYVCVAFTLNQIYKELERFSKTRSFDEIRQSLEILSSSMCELSWENGEGDTLSCKSPIIFDLRKIKQNDVNIAYNAKKELYRVTLHPTVTKDIVDKSFRLINYDKHMTISGFLARWLHIRLSRYFTWANHHSRKPYHISMSNIYRNSCAPLYKDVFRNKIRVVEALKELSKIGVVDLSKLEITPKRIPGSRKNSKPVDFIFNIYPQEAFQKDQKFSNFQFNQINKRNNFTELARRFQSN